jgi:hypothetical protein
MLRQNRDRSLLSVLTGRVPVEIKEGDEIKNDLSGENFVITKIVNSMSMIVLRSRNGDRQIMTGIDSLETFYKMKGAKL